MQNLNSDDVLENEYFQLQEELRSALENWKKQSTSKPKFEF